MEDWSEVRVCEERKTGAVRGANGIVREERSDEALRIPLLLASLVAKHHSLLTPLVANTAHRRVIRRKERAAEVLFSILADFVSRCQLDAFLHWSEITREQCAKEQRVREVLHRLNERLAVKLGQAERVALSRLRASVAHSKLKEKEIGQRLSVLRRYLSAKLGHMQKSAWCKWKASIEHSIGHEVEVGRVLAVLRRYLRQKEDSELRWSWAMWHALVVNAREREARTNASARGVLYRLTGRRAALLGSAWKLWMEAVVEWTNMHQTMVHFFKR